MKPVRLLALGTFSALLLAGCGGNGGDGPQLTLPQLQGYWTGNVNGVTTPVGGATRARAVVLEDGNAWIFLHDGSQASEPLLGLATATVMAVQQTFTGTGKRYPASGASVADITVDGGAPSGNAMTIDVSSGGATSHLAVTQDVAYNTPATQANVVGTWHFTKAGGTITADWIVANDGALTGTSSLGCTYSGSVRPRNATTAVYAVAVTETCTGSTKQLSGIGRLNTARTFLTFGLTTTDGEEAEAFAAQKQ